MNPEEEIAALKAALTDLDARIRRLERRQPAEPFTDPLAQFNEAAEAFRARS